MEDEVNNSRYLHFDDVTPATKENKIRLYINEQTINKINNSNNYSLF